MDKSALISVDRNFEFFTPLDIISSLFGLTVLLIIVYQKRRRHIDLEYYGYYPIAFLFKVLFVLANCTFYIVVYKGGGDSIGFWDGAVKLNNLFWSDPVAYFSEIFSNPEHGGQFKNFNSVTGFPDGTIYGEPSSFSISKIVSIFTFFTFKGYLLISLIFAYITTNASWKLFEMVRNYKLHSDRVLAFAILFIPSLSFWCGGISKDSIMWICLCYFIINIYRIISPEYKSSIFNWIAIVICLYFMYRIRSFMLIVALAPVLFAYSARIKRTLSDNKIKRFFIRSFIILFTVTGILVFFQSSISEELIQEAAVINNDMTNNETYGDNRYDLGITDYSLGGMLRAAPNSIIAGLYRPFLWESLSVSLILNGLESMVLLYLTFKFFFSKNVLQNIKLIREHEFLIYSFFLLIILAYFAGFTSILFGVLVRFKAPLIPFLIIVLTARLEYTKTKSSEI